MLKCVAGVCSWLVLQVPKAGAVDSFRLARSRSGMGREGELLIGLCRFENISWFFTKREIDELVLLKHFLNGIS